MVRRKCKRLTACLLMLALIPIAAVASDATAVAGIPVFDTASGRPEAGTLHTQLPVTVSGTGSVEVVFATAVYRDSTEELVSIAVDRGQLQSPGGTHITKKGALKICAMIVEKIQEGAAADTPEGDVLKPLAALLRKVQP